MIDKDFEPEMIHACDHESGSTTATKPAGLSTERESLNLPRNGKATGPRSERGKQRSARNATKHGVFAKAVLLKGESRAEYERLLAGLMGALQPAGTLEELLVEKLATDAWRHRRLLLAEGAEIRKNMEFVEWNLRNRQREEADQIGNEPDPLGNHGLIQKIHNSVAIERCLELLTKLQRQIGENGLDPDYDIPLLQTIYRNSFERGLYDTYELWLDTSQTSEEERMREGYASPEQCRKNIMEEIAREIRHLKRIRKSLAYVEARQMQLEAFRHSIPDAEALDRLLRYEATLERAFERVLNQLERLQRMRLGQPVLPKLEVHHSLS